MDQIEAIPYTGGASWTASALSDAYDLVWSEMTAGYKPITYLVYDSLSDDGQAPCDVLQMYMDNGIEVKIRTANEAECSNVPDTMEFSSFAAMGTNMAMQLRTLFTDEEAENCVLNTVFTPFNGQ